MKVVIIGGGIAGLTLGVFFRKKNIETVINERLVNMPKRGHAFLMHTDGLSILKELNTDSKSALPGKMVDAFILKRPSGKEIKHLHLDSWKCIKRRDLMRFLHDLFPKELIKGGREFSHFIYENEKVVAAVFTNGEVEYGDIFVGADGENSKVRESILGKVDFTPVAVKEIVGVSYNEKLGQIHSSTFTKFQDNTTGLAFGMIPTSQNEYVWFMQYDPTANDLADVTPEKLSLFCTRLLKDFPPEVAELLSTNDFTRSYIWNTRDFDLMPEFHHKNVVLIGDAAHVSLPFTSAGTTNAIVDAKTLAGELGSLHNHEKAFERYYHKRANEIEKHIKLGRKLKSIFLNPNGQNDDDIPVPLIAQKENDNLIAGSKQIQVLYFTDPICSTCWIIQPLLRKLKLEYGNYLNIRYCMGGMLPSWGEYNKGKISNPADAAQHWEEVCVLHEMPLDGDVWIEDPLSSSYPPSIAFKAAQMQDNNLALLFLRRIKEMVFVEKKNIIKWEFLEKAAFEAGLDSARFLRDFEGRAKELFKEDLTLGKELGVTSFPTLIFSDRVNNSITLKGYQTYERYEEIILSLVPSAKKEVIDTDPKNLFSHFPTMADKEFALLSNMTRAETATLMDDLYNKGYLEKYESKNGILWKSNYAELDPL
jgi:2-polyprenyl-6-methoxyphenol hydroxylase-like FAD-dependent oxidoreductase/predicted DsbA family dithiol-disulfide isomerase